MQPQVDGLASLITLNWEHYDELTGPFIRFVGNHTPPPFELIVVDQGSKNGDADKLVADAGRFDFLKVHLLPENVGFPAGNNVGLKYAAGEFIIYTNNDVTLSGDWLTPIIEALKVNPRSLVGISLIDKGGWNEYEKDGVKFAIPWMEGYLIGVTRGFVEEVGEFDEAFGIGSLEDLDLSWRAQKAGYEMVVVPEVETVFHHMRGKTVYDPKMPIDQMSISKANYEMMKQRVMEGYYDNFGEGGDNKQNG